MDEHANDTTITIVQSPTLLLRVLSQQHDQKAQHECHPVDENEESDQE